MRFTALHLLMTEADRADVAELLIAAGADVHSRTLQRGEREKIALLERYGAGRQ